MISCFRDFSVLVAPTPIFISLECFKPLLLEIVQCAAVMTQKRDIIVSPQKDQTFRLIIVTWYRNDSKMVGKPFKNLSVQICSFECKSRASININNILSDCVNWPYRLFKYCARSDDIPDDAKRLSKDSHFIPSIFNNRIMRKRTDCITMWLRSYVLTQYWPNIDMGIILTIKKSSTWQTNFFTQKTTNLSDNDLSFTFLVRSKAVRIYQL